MKEDAIEFESDELEAASHWHGGQGSMLYAISSTGSLSRGTIRPRNYDEDRPMTDSEWMADLAARLESEANMCAGDARKQAKKAKGKERAELLNEAGLLDSIARKAARGP